MKVLVGLVLLVNDPEPLVCVFREDVPREIAEAFLRDKVVETLEHEQVENCAIIVNEYEVLSANTATN